MLTTFGFKNRFQQIYLFFLTALILQACNRHSKVDVSHIPVNVTIERFDHDFARLQNPPADLKAQALQQKYGVFYTDFIARILQAGSTQDTSYFKTLHDVFNSQAYQDLKHEVDSVYPNLDKQNAELTDAFRRIRYYFPKQPLPKVYAYFSGFQAQTSIGDGYFAIGLDLFLGAKSKFYPALIEAYPHYISRRFTPDNIAPRTIETLLRENIFPEPDADKSLLSRMVYNGKIMYLMNQLLPDVPDSLKIGYTPQQLTWAQKFEGNTWAYFLEENLLYETDYNRIQKYLNEAPFTPGLGEHNDSAPKLAIFTGWQIVKQYMERHPEVTLPQLIAMNDAQEILNQSRYRPKVEK
jgi:gliding motility-associated lipoprotein GldB